MTTQPPPAALTLDDLNELAYPLHRAATAGFKVVTIDVEHAKQLLAMARRLVETEDMLNFLYRRETVPEIAPMPDLFGLARELGWRPEGGSDG